MGEQFTSPELELGKSIASGLEADGTEDPATEYMRIFLPNYPHREYEINFIFKGVPILVKMDQFDPAGPKIGEIKTGHAPWTQRRVDEHGQLTFYALGAFMDTGKVPEDISLYWAPTEKTPEGLRITGDIKAFKTIRTIKDFGLIAPRIVNVWEGIAKVTKQFYESQS